MGLTPTKSYEDLLGDGIESLMGKGFESLAQYAEALNALNIRGPNGRKWTETLLGAELKRLGA